jgi:hypothetical protein
VIADKASAPEQVDHPGYLVPVAYKGGAPLPEDTEPSGDVYWQPELSASGPVSIVLSQGSHRVVVYRNGIEIGSAPLTINGDQPFESHALVLVAGPSSNADPYVPDSAKYHWLRIGVPGRLEETGTQPDAAALARLKIPLQFVKNVNSILTPGATVFVTNEPLSPESSGPVVQVVDADPPHGTHRS